MRVEDVDVVESHPPETLIEAGEEILAGAPLAIRPGPHEIASLRGDDQLVAIRLQVAGEDRPEVLLSRAGGWAVVVGEGEVGDAEVEGAPNDRALRLDDVNAAEVVPEAERDGGKAQAAAAGAAVAHLLITIRGGKIRHSAPQLACTLPNVTALRLKYESLAMWHANAAL